MFPYGMDGRGVGVRFPAGVRFLPDNVQTGSLAHPTSYTICTVDYSPGGKAVGHEGDDSPPTCAEVKIAGATPPFPHRSS
jgi:hypothetical protein